MHDQHGLACGQPRQPIARTIDLIDETLAAGRPVAGGRFPERLVGVAELDRELVVTPPGPGAKILFAKPGSSTGSSPSVSAVSRVRRAGLHTARACGGSRALSAAKALLSLTSAGASGP